MQVGISPGHLGAGLGQIELPLHEFSLGIPVSADRIEFTLQLLFICDRFLNTVNPRTANYRLAIFGYDPCLGKAFCSAVPGT